MGRVKRFTCAGFSMIELMVATAIFSMGMGGLSFLMLSAVRGTADAAYLTTAASQGESLAEMILLNSAAGDHYVYPATEGSDCQPGQLCSPESRAADDLGRWRQRLSVNLPQGSGLVCRDSTPEDGIYQTPGCDGLGSLVVKVFWFETGHRDAAENGWQRLVTRLPY